MHQVQGQFHCSMDAKGRLSLPARLKDVLKARGESALVLAFYDGSLHGYTLEYWRKLERKVSKKPLFSKSARAFVLGFLAMGTEISVDKLGRILVPGPLRERAGLERDVVVLSYLGQIEIWDRARFDARQAAEAEELDLDEFVGDLTVPLDDDGVD